MILSMPNPRTDGRTPERLRLFREGVDNKAGAERIEATSVPLASSLKDNAHSVWLVRAKRKKAGE
jgi:hypothetical protein